MSSTYAFHTLDVFTDQLFGGNPLAVFPAAQGLSSQQMQAIAKELNLSETVFVLPQEQADCDFKLRIFTPLAEIPFAGHPTVGTAYLLAHLKLIETEAKATHFQEEVGKVPVALQWENGQIRNTFLQAAQLPEFDVVPNIDLTELLGLNSEDIHSDFAAEVISCGLPFLYICLKNNDAVDRSSLNMELWKSIATSTAAHIYILAIAPPNDHHIYARMFAPALGIAEDPATGSAATSLAGYLDKYFPSDAAQETWQIQQGKKMGRPSELFLTLDRTQGALTIQVGGSSVLVSHGEMRVA